MDHARPSGLTDAVNLWIEMTGIDPSATSFTMRTLSLRSTYERIQEAMDLDPTDVTAYLLLHAVTEAYIRERTFSVRTLIDKPEQTAAYLDQVRRLLAMVTSPAMIAIGADFKATVRKAIAAYGALTPAVEAVLNADFDLAFLRRDALRSITKLRVDQFLAGSPEEDGVVPVYQKAVHQFWNVNSLLAASVRMPSGVSLNLIRDPDEMQSYFVFAVRNGGNLFLLSDVPDHGHPLARYKRRRADRDLGDRAEKNWFPYDLLGVQVDDEGELYIQKTYENGLIGYQQQAFPLSPIAALGGPEVIWTSMMFDLIVAKFWHQGYVAPTLSYTGEMIRTVDTLAIAAHHSQVPVVQYRGIEAPALAVADVLSDKIDAAALGEHGVTASAHNRWMEMRYAGRVSPEAVNLLAASHTQHTLALADDSTVSTNLGRPAQRANPFDRTPQYKLRALDASAFGTQERLLADRVYLARHNLAVNIQKLADEEYAQRRVEVVTWFAERARANVRALYPLIARFATDGGYWQEAPSQIDKTFAFGEMRYQHTRKVAGRRYYNILNMVDLNDKSHNDYDLGVWLPAGLVRGKPHCIETGAVARWRFKFAPETAGDLCLLAGCTLDELPDVLRHWTREEPYVGNDILNRIDPLGADLHDPWRKEKFVVKVHFSVRGLARLHKQHGQSVAAAGA